MYDSSSAPENVTELVSTQIGFEPPNRGPGTYGDVQNCRVVPSAGVTRSFRWTASSCIDKMTADEGDLVG